MPVPPRSRRLPPRSAVMAGLLSGTLLLVGILAYQAVEANRSHARVAQQALVEVTNFAAWELTSTLRRDLFNHFMGPGFQVVADAGGSRPDTSLASFQTVLRYGDEVGLSAFASELDFVFRYNLHTRNFDWVGRTDPDQETRTWLADVMEEKARAIPGATEPPWLLTFRGREGAERAVALILDPYHKPRGQLAFGFQASSEMLQGILAKSGTDNPLLPPALTNGKANAEILSFRIFDPTGREIFRSGPQYPSTYSAEDTVGAQYGGLGVEVRLRPEVLESLVIGGLPRSRLPVIFGLLAVTAGLVLMALFQVRREHELSRLRSDFISSVSHELRTPLAQIRMFGETLLLGRVRSEEERRRSLEIVVKEARRLSHQVDNVLLFSRAQRNDVRLNPVEVSLAPLAQEVLESFSPLAEAQGVTVKISQEEECTAWADPGSVKQVLLNLLENAVKYGPGGQTVDLRVGKGSPGMVRISVDDEGEGIPADRRDLVFSPYSRLDRHRDSGIAGSGIGLAVVKELVQHQGGSVRAEEAPGGGARFVVELPEAGGKGGE